MIALGMLSAITPMALDLYLPALPQLGRQLRTDDSAAQMTIGACVLGLAVGQLVWGPISDSIGRRTPLLIGTVGFALFSIGCATSPSIEFLIAARFLQGAAGAAGIVVSRAIVRDLYEGRDVARVLATLMAVTVVAPVVAPLVGGAALIVTDWRGVFVVLSVLGIGLSVFAWRVVPETLSSADRHIGGLARQFGDMGRALRSRSLLWHSAAVGCVSASIFTYLSMSAFVLQREQGLDSTQFALVFAVNSVGLVAGTFVNRALLRRWTVGRVAFAALVGVALAATAVTLIGVWSLPLIAVLVALFVMMMAHGGAGSNLSALALIPVSRGVGGVAGVVGAVQYVFAAVVPPIASVVGTTVVVMGATMTVFAVLAVFALAVARADPRGRHGVTERVPPQSPDPNNW